MNTRNGAVITIVEWSSSGADDYRNGADIRPTKFVLKAIGYEVSKVSVFEPEAS